MTAQRATLRLGLTCDNRCIFCAQRGLDGSDGDLLWPPPPGEISFVGGEPLLVEKLPELVAAARVKGFSAVGVQTNGRRLAERIAELRAAGLDDVHLSIHGATAAVHDYHTGVDGSFLATMAGLAAARAHGVTVVVTTVLTRSDFRALAELPSLLASRGVAAWHIAVPRATGDAGRHFDRVMPRLGLALPFALHAIDAAQRRGLPAFISGAPLCALGSFAARSLRSDGGAYAAACDACAARPYCDGVDPAYLARFDGDELAARAAPAVNLPAIARLFVGAGELAPVTAVTKSAPRSLPLLRPQPARAEVSASAPKKTGDALRDIFPSLFEPK